MTSKLYFSRHPEVFLPECAVLFLHCVACCRSFVLTLCSISFSIYHLMTLQGYWKCREGPLFDQITRIL